MQKKIPLILVTGFLGSGKTSFISNYLSNCPKDIKVAIIQNEFAQLGIDSDVLRKKHPNFSLRELYRGSIFCACLFSSFKDAIIDLVGEGNVDVILIEATGIADPIGIAQIMEDKRIQESCYFDKIITIVDLSRFMKLQNIFGVKHQIEVADFVFLNKSDMVNETVINEVSETIHSINPIAKLIISKQGAFLYENLVTDSNYHSVVSHTHGSLTKCGQGNYISRVFKASSPIKEENFYRFMNSLDSDILRLKGYFMNEHHENFMIQYVPGQIEILPCKRTSGVTELISIGYKEPEFRLLR